MPDGLYLDLQMQPRGRHLCRQGLAAGRRRLEARPTNTALWVGIYSASVLAECGLLLPPTAAFELYPRSARAGSVALWSEGFDASIAIAVVPALINPAEAGMFFQGAELSGFHKGGDKMHLAVVVHCAALLAGDNL